MYKISITYNIFILYYIQYVFETVSFETVRRTKIISIFPGVPPGDVFRQAGPRNVHSLPLWTVPELDGAKQLSPMWSVQNDALSCLTIIRSMCV